jgi:hypothetical protein
MADGLRKTIIIFYLKCGIEIERKDMKVEGER